MPLHRAAGCRVYRAAGAGISERAHRGVFAHLGPRLVRRHAGADAGRQDRHPMGAIHLAPSGLQHAPVRHRRRQRAGVPVGPKHRGVARNGTHAGRLFRRSAPTSAIRRFPRAWATAWERWRNWSSRRGGADRPHLHHLPHAGGKPHPRRAREAGRHHGLGLHRARLLRLPIAPLALDRHPRPAGGERLRDAHLRHRRAGEAVLRPGRRQPVAARGGLADGADRDGDQAHFRGPGLFPAAALRAGRPGDSRLEVPHHDGLRGRAAAPCRPGETIPA